MRARESDTVLYSRKSSQLLEENLKNRKIGKLAVWDNLTVRLSQRAILSDFIVCQPVLIEVTPNLHSDSGCRKVAHSCAHPYQKKVSDLNHAHFHCNKHVNGQKKEMSSFILLLLCYY